MDNTITQPIMLDSCVVIRVLRDPGVGSKIRHDLRGKIYEFVVCGTVLDEVSKVTKIPRSQIICKLAGILNKEVRLDDSDFSKEARHLTYQFQICHNGDNKILSICRAKYYILLTFDRMLLKASQFVGVAAFNPLALSKGAICF